MSPRSSPKCRALCVSFIHPVIKSLQQSAGFPSIPAVCVAKQQQPQRSIFCDPFLDSFRSHQAARII